MNFSLIICTYQRPKPLFDLLHSVVNQSLYPNEIIIVDGSLDNKTKQIFDTNNFENLNYFLVDAENRGLTKQRNFGINNISFDSEIVCFLDDDIILTPHYFQTLIETYKECPKAIGVGGYIINESNWTKVDKNYKPKLTEFFFDGYKMKESTRFIARKILGLDSNEPPGYMSNYSHGRSIGFLPPSGKVYKTELLMGGVSSFRKVIFAQLSFSTYFEGYGLYEDADFTIRASKIGQLYVNTSAQLFHYHHPDGRPNQYKYGKMVVRNGYYVWKVKNPNPKFTHILKWNAITILLIMIRFTNIFTFNKVNFNKALTESFGRCIGYFSIFMNKNKII